MRRIIITLSIAFFLASCASIEKHNLQITKLHPVEDLHEDIDKEHRQLRRNHPHLYQYTSKELLDFKFDSLKKAINTPIDSRTFYKKVASVTKYIGQGHMSVSPPTKRLTKKERKARNKTKFDINNLDLEYLDEKLFITHARGKDSALINTEVLKIENENSKDLIEKYKKIIASDGYNKTFHNRVVGNRFIGYYFQDKGRFDSIKLTLKNADSTFVKTYKRVLKKDTTKTKMSSIKGDSIKTIKKTKLTKAERKARKLKNKAKRKYNSKYGYIPLRNEYTRDLSFVGKDSTVALLKIKGFSNGKYKDFYDDSFSKLDSLKTQTLIIDLRNNFGGRLNEVTYLYSYLTNENFVMINKSEISKRFPILKSVMSNTNSLGLKALAGILSPVLATVDLLKTSKKQGKLYYKFKSSKEQEPKPHNFKGKIYVLINGNSFSASSLLSTQLKGSKRATFVGEETGGAYNGTVAGLYKNYEMPNTKVKARIGLAHIDSKYKTTPDGYGVKPDIKVVPTYQDRLNKIDPELKWVLEDVERKKVN